MHTRLRGASALECTALEGVLQRELEETRIRSITREKAGSSYLSTVARDTRVARGSVGWRVEQVEHIRAEL